MSSPTNSFLEITLNRLFRSFTNHVSWVAFHKWIGPFVLCLLVLGCQTKTTTFKTFDPKSWMSETKVCTGYRNSVINNMESEFDQFLGMNETELIAYLGTPEKTVLYTRGQKFFSYKLNCNDSLATSNSLRIRFSALDFVNEVLILD